MGRKIAVFFVLMLFAHSAHAAPAVVAVVAIAAAYGVTGVIATAIAIGLAAASAYMAFTMKVPTPKQSQQQLKQMLRSSRAPRNVWYGQGLVSGAMIFAEEQVGDDENDDGTFDEWLYMAIALCDHPIQAMDKLYLNEEESITFGDKLKYQLHNNSTTVDQYLLDNAPSWKSDMIGKSSTWLRLAMRFDRELFANGVPTPRVKYRGKNDIWDPRNDSYGYTNNAALVVLDFHINYLGIPKDRMILSGFGSWKDAANLCDENIINADGSSSKRYAIDGVFNLDEKPTDIINDMLAACGGSMVRMGGSYGLLPAAYNGPATFTITSSDIISDVTVQVEPATSDAINTVKGSFVDPKQGYVETDYPVVIDEGAKVRDGGELSEDLSLRFVTDVYQAQRLANILLRKSLTGGNVKFTANLNGAYARIGRVITLDIPESSITGEYRVTSQSFDLINGVELELVREDIDIYDDAIGNVYVPPPLTNLPVGVIAAPSGVQFLVESIGEVVQGVIAWRINAPQSVSADIRFKDFDTNNIVMVGSSIGNSFNVNSLIAGNYIVEVRSVTMTGRVSSWSTTSFIVDVPPMPDSVKVVASNWNILLTPNVTAGIPSGTLFEFRYLEDDRSYLSQSPNYGESDFPLSSVIGVASSYNHGGLTPDRWQHYWVRGTNSYGNSDWLYVQTGTLKEQDLVTTVVERLQAIEILSANWDEGDGEAGNYANGRGYKLFAPDPNDPTADGRAVFNDVYMRGRVVAESGEIENRMNVGNSYIDGRTNQNFLYSNGGVFRVTQGGKMYAKDGDFGGTVRANKILGDIVSAQAKSVRQAEFNNDFVNLVNFSVKATQSGLNRTLSIGGVSLLSYSKGTGANSGKDDPVRIIAETVINGSVIQRLDARGTGSIIAYLPPSSAVVGTGSATAFIQVRTDKINGAAGYGSAVSTKCTANLFPTGAEFN